MGKKTKITKKLTKQQRRFVDEYMIDLNATQAAIRAKYGKKNAGTVGPRLVRKSHVAKEIQKRMDRRSKRTEIKADEIVEQLNEIRNLKIGALVDKNGALLPIKQWPDAVQRCVTSIDVQEEFTGSGKDRKSIGYTKKIRIESRIKSLELLARHLGMLNTKVELDVADGFVELLERVKNSPMGSPQGMIKHRGEDE